jgi:hypothetical protein
MQILQAYQRRRFDIHPYDFIQLLSYNLDSGENRHWGNSASTALPFVHNATSLPPFGRADA